MYKQKGKCMEEKYIYSEHSNYISIKDQLLVDIAIINDEGKLSFIREPTETAKNEIIDFLNRHNVTFTL